MMRPTSHVVQAERTALIRSLASRVAASLHGTKSQEVDPIGELGEFERLLEDNNHVQVLGINGNQVMKEASIKVQNLSLYLGKVAQLTYARIRDIAGGGEPYLAIRAMIDSMDEVAISVRFTGWFDEKYYAGYPGDPPAFEDVVFMTMSQALQFNCDLRDFGFLLTPEGTMSDSAWKTARTVPRERLRVGVKPYTFQTTAALNLTAVDRQALAAYTRGYGVSYGLIPNRESVWRREYCFTLHFPAKEDIRAVVDYTELPDKVISQTSAHLLCMFGLLHLAKDHTFKTNDSNMQRIATSYLQTLRTDIPQTVLDGLITRLETYVRTAQHPFGLAQTYWFALVLAWYGCLPVAMNVRVSVTPPPVQRLMLVNAARLEWGGLQAAQIMDEIHGTRYPVIQEAIRSIAGNAPAYSALHRLYAVETQAKLTYEAQTAVDLMVPAAYGFVIAYHTNDGKGADGIGLALNLNNIRRDAKAIAVMWASSWEMYASDTANMGLKAFLPVRNLVENPGVTNPRGR